MLVNSNSNERGAYAVGYGSGVIKWLEMRHATHQAAFFLPHLSPGMSLLDCGCGPGSITLELAEAVAPGPVTGLDLERSMVELASQRARERNVASARFEVGSIYELPFRDHTFDGVFAHALLEHLSEPLTAIREMRRVLKSGGVLGVRSIDIGGRIIYPTNEHLEQYHHLLETVVKRDGRDMRIGRCLGAILREEGFTNVELSASYDCYWGPESVGALVAAWVEFPFLDEAVEVGLTDKASTENIRTAYREWGEIPDAFLAWPMCQVVGWKVN